MGEINAGMHLRVTVVQKLVFANGRDRNIITDHQEAPASRISPELCLNDERTQSCRRSQTHAYERSFASAHTS